MEGCTSTHRGAGWTEDAYGFAWSTAASRVAISSSTQGDNPGYAALNAWFPDADLRFMTRSGRIWNNAISRKNG
jgi:hypothetical protein